MTRRYSKAFGLRLAAAGLAAFGVAALAAGTYAQQKPPLTVDTKANPAKQPTVDTSKKAPVVNIVTPNAGGVSHNVWKDYNVGKEGIVFNNATQAGQSQLAGQLGANQNLTNGAAKLILNEVTGGNISQLLGYTEIFGHSADFVLANPAGIACNGCGFINTPHVTLTTGLPDFNGDGSLKGFSVSGSGSIRFEGTGANVTGVETFDVVSRSIFMGGAIDDAALAAEVGLFAGRNSFDYASRTVTALSDDGSKKPGYAIDTNAAGAIHAGKIGVASTEKGVTARTAADMQAGAGGMMLTTEGKLVIAKARSQGAIRAKSLSADIQVTGQLWSQATLELRAGGNIAVLSQASAGALGNVSLDAQDITLSSGAVVGAGLDDQGKFTGNGALNLYAANLTNAGTLKATGGVTLGLSGVLANQGTGVIEAGQALGVNAAQATNAGQLTAQGALNANIAAGAGGDGSFVNQGTVGGAQVALNAGSLSNTGTLSAQGALQASTSGDLANAGTVSGQTLNLAVGGTLANQAAGKIAAAGDATLSAKTLTNAGSVAAGGKLAATATDLSNTGRMTATGDAAFNVSGTLSNDATGKIHADGALSIQAGAVKNYGGVDVTMPRGEISGLTLAISAGSVENAGNLLATQSLNIASSGQVVNVLGTIRAGGYLSIAAAGNLENLSGLIQGADVSVNAQTIENITLVRRGSELIVPEEFTGVLRVEAPGSAGQQAWWGLSGSGGNGLWAGLIVKASPAGQGNGNGHFIEPGTAPAGAHTDVAAQQAEISATGGVKLSAAKDINNAGGKLAATNGDLALNAGGDINVDAQALSSAQGSTSTVSHVKSTLSAGGNITVNAGGDATIKAADVTSGKNTRIAAQGQVTLGAAQDEYHEHWSHKSCGFMNFNCKTTTVNKDNLTVVATSIHSGGWVEVESKTKDILTTATNVTAAGSIKLLSDLGNVLLEAGQNSAYSQSYTKKSSWWGLTGSASGATDSSTTIAPTFVSAVNDVQIVAHADFVLKGSGVKAGGSIFVTAQNVQIVAMQNLYFHQDIAEKWGIFADAAAGNGTASVTLAWQDSTTTNNEWKSISQAASLEAGGNVSIDAASKVSVTGSTVTAAGDVTIQAAQVELAAAQDTVTKQTTTTTDSFGILPAMNNGFGFAIGAKKVSDETGQTQVSNMAALIGSTGGSVFINAGEAITAQGSIIESLAGNVTLNAGTIALAAGVDSFTTYAIHKERFVGFDVSVEAGGNNPLSALQKGAGYLSAAEKTKDPQAKRLYEAAAGVQAAQGALNLYKAGGDLTGLTSFDFKFGVGVSSTTSETTASSQQASGGYVMAANNIGLYATAGDLTLTGANVSAYNVTLSAQRDVVMQSLALTSAVSSSTSSFSAFVGLGASVAADPQSSSGFKADWGIKGSVSDSTSKSETVSVSHAQTVVKGANWVTVSSGRDTNLYGATVSGGGITAQVARNLNIVSDQDTERMSASLTSWSLSGTIGLYGSPSSISGSYAKGDGYGNYASVTTTSGLFAGSSGYAVTVGGTTTLTGAALASTADASKNMLTTGALVTKDLTNSMSWKASYWGISASISTAGTGGVQPALSQKTGGSSTGVAQSTIAPGTISIVNASLQKSLTGKTPDQIVAALNRSATALNKAADKLPGTIAQTLQDQADRSAAMTAASSSTAKLVGDVATMFRDAALKAAAEASAEANAKKKAGTFTIDDQKALDAALAQVKLWDEGGEARALLHGATQGVLAWIGGGYSLDAGLRGAGGAIVASYLAPLAAQQAQKLLKESGLGGDPQTTATLAKFIGELAVTGMGAALGNMGAVTAASVYMNNYLKHKIRKPGDKDELQELTDKLREANGDQEKISAIIKEYAELSIKNQNELVLSCQNVASQACTDAKDDLVYYLTAFREQPNWWHPGEKLKSFAGASENNFIIPATLMTGDKILYDDLWAYRTGETKTYRDFVLTYIQDRSREAQLNNVVFRYTLAGLNITEEGALLVASRGACRTVASAACGAYLAQAALIGDDMAKQIMQAYTGQAALSPLTQALVNSGLSKENAEATMFLINMGVVEWTIVQGVGQLRATNAARAGSAEQVARIEQQTAKLNEALADSANGERQLALAKPTLPVAGEARIGSAADKLYTSQEPIEGIFPELKGVNPSYDPAGRNINCASCVNATTERLLGEDANAVAQNTGYATNAALDLAPSMYTQEALTIKQVVQEMESEGKGAIGAVIIPQANVDHVINVVNRDGVVYFVDSQIGKVVTLSPDTTVQFGLALRNGETARIK